MSANTEIVRALFKAYSDEDRRAAEALLADDFRFTSPLDNGLDRAAYFQICWPNSQNIARFDIRHLLEQGELVAVTYEATLSSGKRIRNTELHTVRNGLIASVEVFFGWNLPHDVPRGQHRDPR